MVAVVVVKAADVWLWLRLRLLLRNRSDWFGVTHFNSGRVGDYLKELTDADIAGMDGVMCSKFPLVASMWGASNCTLTDEKMATFFTKF